MNSSLSQSSAAPRRARLKLLAVLLVCAAPVIASYFTYYVIRPEGRVNYGALVEPQRSIAHLGAQTVDGGPVALSSLNGKWVMITVSGPDGCDRRCEESLLSLIHI